MDILCASARQRSVNRHDPAGRMSDAEIRRLIDPPRGVVLVFNRF